MGSARNGTVSMRIGHGRLAKRGVLVVMPTMESFPYTIRVLSEITESNGSSSMALACDTSLSLMDAGMPLNASVAGIAMGLLKEGDMVKVKVLEVDKQGRIRLSMKAIEEGEGVPA